MAGTLFIVAVPLLVVVEWEPSPKLCNPLRQTRRDAVLDELTKRIGTLRLLTG